MSKKYNDHIGKGIFWSAVAVVGAAAFIAYKKRDRLKSIADDILGKIDAAAGEEAEMPEELCDDQHDIDKTPDLIIKDTDEKPELDNNGDGGVEDTED